MTTGARHFPPIDGLRAVAVAGVVAYHAGLPTLPGGFAGVDVFFVISGFLITRLLLREYGDTGSLDLVAFYARRARRLLPVFFVVTVTTLLLAALVMLPFGEERPRFIRSVQFATVYLSNWYFARTSGGYFDPAADLMPMLHTWSLAVEEQFYLLWPLAILVAGSVARALGQRGMIGIGSLLTLLTTASILLAFYGAAGDAGQRPGFYYAFATRAWELGIGAILALLILPEALGRGRRALFSALGFGGLAAVLASFVVLDRDLPFPGPAAVLPTLGTAAVIVGISSVPGGPLARLLALKPLLAVGLVSYGWYLWHWPLMALYRLDAGGVGEPLVLGLIAIGSLALAAITYHLVEQPWRRGSFATTLAPRKVLAVAAVTSLAIIAGAQALRWSKLAVNEASRASIARYAAAAADAPDEGCMQVRPYDGLRQAPACGLFGTATLEAPVIVVLGDSHADMLGPAVRTAAIDLNARVVYRALSGCTPLLKSAASMSRRDADCQAFINDVIAELASAPPGRVRGIVLASTWAEGQCADQRSCDRTSARAAFETNLSRTLQALTAPRHRVVLIAPTPSHPRNPLLCLPRRDADQCLTSRANVDQERSDRLAAMMSAAALLPTVQLVDLIDALCDASSCRAEQAGHVLYRDNNHITATAARQLGPALRPAVTWLLSTSP